MYVQVVYSTIFSAQFDSLHCRNDRMASLLEFIIYIIIILRYMYFKEAVLLLKFAGFLNNLQDIIIILS